MKNITSSVYNNHSLNTEMDWDLDYEDLVQDRDFVENCEELRKELIELQKLIERLLPLKQNFEKLSIAARIEIDLLFAFALNSLYWVNLRIEGVDVTNHPIKHELNRIKAAMVRWQMVKDKSKRPTVNLNVAKRFVRNGLYDHTQKPPNKKIKFED